MGADSPTILLRSARLPADVPWIVEQHGSVYAVERGFDADAFAAYVAGPLGEAVLRAHPRERIWIAEQAGRPVGSVALVERAAGEGQIRWFLVLPEARRQGAGARLLGAALAFAREQDYDRLVLWTVRGLEAAARLYRRAGFRLTVTRPAHRWGCDVVEERYDADLR